MTDFKNDTKKAMIKAWKSTFKSSIRSFTYERNEESYVDNPNNDSSGSQSYYDPVTETYIYPTGSPSNVSTTLTGLLRNIDRDSGKDPQLFVTDLKLTVLYDDFVNVFGTAPHTSDLVTYDNKEYRVVKYVGDSVDCFYHIFIRGV